MAQITATSKYKKLRPNHAKDHAQYAIAYGKGKKRKSFTMHCSKAVADQRVKDLTAQGL